MCAGPRLTATHRTQAKFINKERFEEFRGFGGVRIEDVVRVTADGIEQMTTIPRHADAVEAICQGKAVDWTNEPRLPLAVTKEQ